MTVTIETPSGHTLTMEADKRGKVRSRITAGNGKCIHASTQGYEKGEFLKRNLIAIRDVLIELDLESLNPPK